MFNGRDHLKTACQAEKITNFRCGAERILDKTEILARCLSRATLYEIVRYRYSRPPDLALQAISLLYRKSLRNSIYVKDQTVSDLKDPQLLPIATHRVTSKPGILKPKV